LAVLLEVVFELAAAGLMVVVEFAGNLFAIGLELCYDLFFFASIIFIKFG
jgi:hypothetical protein